MNYPDDSSDIIQMSLQEFTRRAEQLSHVENGEDAYVRFVLAGRDMRDGREHCIVVNPLQAADIPDANMFKFTRDFDSIIGITKDIPYTQSLSVFPVPPFAETLKDRSHVMGLAYGPAVSHERSVQVI